MAVLQKALDILEVLSDRNHLGLTEISEQTGASKTSVFRVLATLEGRGFLSKDPVTRKYAPGTQLIGLSCAIVSRIDLVRIARPTLERLVEEFGETANLGIPAESSVLYVDIVEARQSLRMAAHVGARDALHCTALGKALLSAMPEVEGRRLLASYRREATTEKTVTDLEKILADIRAVRVRGYAVDDEETELGARCVGVPIRDAAGHAAAAISISGPTSRVADRRLRDIGEGLQLAAAQIEAQMGRPALAK